MRSTLFVIIALLYLINIQTLQARSFETLNRGAVAISIPESGNYLSWRLLNTDPDDISFNIYRNNVLITDNPVKYTCDYIDKHGSPDSIYKIVPLTNTNPTPKPAENISVWENQYIEIPLSPMAGERYRNRNLSYRPTDSSIGDLDGDGEYELVLKWECISHDNSHSGRTSPTWLEGLEFSGESLWRINLGINIRSGAHYTPFVVFDLDCDGKAEIVCKTADGTIDGTGKRIGNDKDYRNANGYILNGPEYLTVFDGSDGKEIDTTKYIPQRGDISSWGDLYGNRVDRFLAAAAWLDDDFPSVIMTRGYYHGKTSKGRTAIAAWDLVDEKLTSKWVFDTITGGLDEYIGQGCHSLSIGDVDNDGFDEITYGACAIDHDGTGLYSTEFCHGDASHLGDLDPDREGLEFFMPHEEAIPGKIPGVDFRDAKTGEILWSLPVDHPRDIGRGLAGDIYAGSAGAECWSLLTRNLYSCKGEIIGKAPGSCNFLIWWDGDQTRELLDKNWIGKYNPEQWGLIDKIFTADECRSINGSKSNPTLSCDIFGDWREEVIWSTRDGMALRIYTTTIPAEDRKVTLMHDPVYRMSIVWQNAGYNQPPHTGY